MTEWDGERRVLNCQHTQIWRHTFKNEAEPNPQRIILPFDEICQMDFGRKTTVFFPGPQIFLTGTLFGRWNPDPVFL